MGKESSGKGKKGKDGEMEGGEDQPLAKILATALR